MATSPNFNWPEPDNTDLVKNGALAIRTAVNAIDSSMVDLKGGTTGQILAKATNTDMDFVWVANDVGDITAVTASSPLTGGGTSGAITVGIQDATTSVKGAVQLSDSTSTTSSILAATPTAVKAAYDLAVIGSTTNNNLTMVQQYTATESVLKNVPSRIPAAEQLLKQAVYWIDAAQSDNSDQVLDNQGWGAPSLTTQLGSSASADSNDPKFLDFTGTNYVYTPGTSGNFLQVPDAANFDITGDIDLRGYVALDDWTPAAIGTIVSKSDVSTNHSYVLQVISAGNLSLTWSSDGVWSTRKTVNSTVAPTIADGAVLWVRATLDVDNGASGHDVKFYTSTDGVTWTQLGTTVTTAGTTSIYSGTSVVYCGALNSANQLLTGKIYRAQILNGIDGTKVLDVDTSVIGSGSATSFNALTGQTVTINRSTSGKKTSVVTAPLWLFGTDDYMEVADNNLIDFNATDSFTVLFMMRNWPSYGYATNYIKGISTASVPSWYQFNANSSTQSAEFKSGAVTLTRNGASRTDGATSVTGFVLDRTAQTVASITNGALSATSSTSTLGTLENTGTLKIAATGAGNFADFEFFSMAIFRRVLTAAEITTITNYYTARIGA